MRWRHPTKGILPPAAFLEVAETIGILSEIDAIALKKSAEIVARLEADGYYVPKISVNVSMERLRDQELLFAIECLPNLQAQLTFEILETVFIDDLDASFKFLLQQLEAKGIGIEIDDFGSGRASILGLTQIEPTRLKIDKDLVLPLLDRPKQKALLKSIVAMGKSLNIGVTAEGVKHKPMPAFLKKSVLIHYRGITSASLCLHRNWSISSIDGRHSLGAFSTPRPICRSRLILRYDLP